MSERISQQTVYLNLIFIYYTKNLNAKVRLEDLDIDDLYIIMDLE